MSKQTKDPKDKLAELASEHAGLSGNKDKSSRFRCRMIKGRAKSIIRKCTKGAAAQDAAFEDWQASAKAGSAPAEKPCKSSSATSKGDNALTYFG